MADLGELADDELRQLCIDAQRLLIAAHTEGGPSHEVRQLEWMARELGDEWRWRRDGRPGSRLLRSVMRGVRAARSG